MSENTEESQSGTLKHSRKQPDLTIPALQLEEAETSTSGLDEADTAFLDQSSSALEPWGRKDDASTAGSLLTAHAPRSRTGSSNLDLSTQELTTFDLEGVQAPRVTGNVFSKFLQKVRASVSGSGTVASPSIQPQQPPQTSLLQPMQPSDKGNSSEDNSSTKYTPYQKSPLQPELLTAFSPYSTSRHLRSRSESEQEVFSEWDRHDSSSTSSLDGVSPKDATSAFGHAPESGRRGRNARKATIRRQSEDGPTTPDELNAEGLSSSLRPSSPAGKDSDKTDEDRDTTPRRSNSPRTPGKGPSESQAKATKSPYWQSASASAQVTAAQATGKPLGSRSSRVAPATSATTTVNPQSTLTKKASIPSRPIQTDLSTIIESGLTGSGVSSDNNQPGPKAGMSPSSGIGQSRRIFGAISENRSKETTPPEKIRVEEPQSTLSRPKHTMRDDRRSEFGAKPAVTAPGTIVEKVGSVVPEPLRDHHESSLYKTRSLQNLVRRFLGEAEAAAASPSRDYWMQDDNCKECYECKSLFTTFRRKHHCRICGQIFCHKCASTIIPGERFGHAGHIRVCNYCVKLMRSYEEEAYFDGDMGYDCPFASPGSQPSNFFGSLGSSCPQNSPVSPNYGPENKASFDALRKIFTAAGNSFFPSRSRTNTHTEYPDGQNSPVPFRNVIKGEVGSPDPLLDTDIATYISDDSEAEKCDRIETVLPDTPQRGGSSGSGRKPRRRESDASSSLSLRLRSPLTRKASKRTSFQKMDDEMHGKQESDTSSIHSASGSQTIFSQVLANLMPAAGFNNSSGLSTDNSFNSSRRVTSLQDGIDYDEHSAMEIEDGAPEPFLTSSLERSHLSAETQLTGLESSTSLLEAGMPATSQSRLMSRRNSDGFSVWKPNLSVASRQSYYSGHRLSTPTSGYEHRHSNWELAAATPSLSESRSRNATASKRPKSTGSYEFLRVPHSNGGGVSPGLTEEPERLRERSSTWRSPSPMGLTSVPPPDHSNIHGFAPESPNSSGSGSAGWRKEDPRLKHLSSEREKKRRRSFSASAYSRPKLHSGRSSQLRRAHRHDSSTGEGLSKPRSPYQLRARSQTTGGALRRLEGSSIPIRSMHNLKERYVRDGEQIRKKFIVGTKRDPHNALLNNIEEPRSPGKRSRRKNIPSYAYFDYHDITGNHQRMAVDTGAMKHIGGLLRQLLKADDFNGDEIERWAEVVMRLMFSISHRIQPDVRHGDNFDVCQYVKFKKVPTGEPEDSRYISGIVCSKNLAHRRMRRKINHPRILLLTFPLEYQRVENQLISIEAVLSQEREHLRNLVSRVMALKPSVILCEKTVSRYALEYLIQAKVAVAFSVSPTVIRAVARCTQADVIASMDKLSLDPILGTCGRVYVETHVLSDGPKKTYMYFDGCEPSLGGTVVLRGLPAERLASLKRICQLMAYVVYNLKLETSTLNDMYVTSSRAQPTGGRTNMALMKNEGPNDSLLEAEDDGDIFVSELISLKEQIKPYRHTVLSASPDVAFPPPYLLQRCCEELTKFVGRRKRIQDSSVPNFGGIEWEFMDGDLDYEIIKAGLGYSAEIEDMVDPFAHQSIVVMFTNSVREPNTLPCQPPSIQTIEYYRDNDVALGQFIEEIFFESEELCPSKTCQKPMKLHARSYAHGTALVSVTVENRQPSQNVNLSNDVDAIFMWSRCQVCGFESLPMLVAEESWKLSLGKYLELSFYRNNLFAQPSGSCDHDVFTHHSRFFGFHGTTVRFDNEFVPVYDVEMPPIHTVFHPDSYVSIKQDEFRAVWGQITRFYESIQEKLKLYEVVLLAFVGGERVWIFQERLEELWDRAIMERIQMLQFLQQRYKWSNPLDTLSLNSVRQMLWKKVGDWEADFQDLVIKFFKEEKQTIASVNPASPTSSASVTTPSTTGSVTVGQSPGGLLSQLQSQVHKRAASMAAVQGLTEQNVSIALGLGASTGAKSDVEDTPPAARRRAEGVGQAGDNVQAPKAGTNDSVSRDLGALSQALRNSKVTAAPSSNILGGSSSTTVGGSATGNVSGTGGTLAAVFTQPDGIQRRLTMTVPQLMKLFTDIRDTTYRRQYHRFLFRYSLLQTRVPPIHRHLREQFVYATGGLSQYSVKSDSKVSRSFPDGKKLTSRFGEIFGLDEGHYVNWMVGLDQADVTMGILAGLDPPPFWSWFRQRLTHSGSFASRQQSLTMDQEETTTTISAEEHRPSPVPRRMARPMHGRVSLDPDAVSTDDDVDTDIDDYKDADRTVTLASLDGIRSDRSTELPRVDSYASTEGRGVFDTVTTSEDTFSLIGIGSLPVRNTAIGPNMALFTLLPKRGTSPTQTPMLFSSSVGDQSRGDEMEENQVLGQYEESYVDRANKVSEVNLSAIEYEMLESISNLTTGRVYRSCLEPSISRRLSRKYMRERLNKRNSRTHVRKEKESRETVSDEAHKLRQPDTRVEANPLLDNPPPDSSFVINPPHPAPQPLIKPVPLPQLAAMSPATHVHTRVSRQAMKEIENLPPLPVNSLAPAGTYSPRSSLESETMTPASQIPVPISRRRLSDGRGRRKRPTTGESASSLEAATVPSLSVEALSPGSQDTGSRPPMGHPSNPSAYRGESRTEDSSSGLSSSLSEKLLQYQLGWEADVPMKVSLVNLEDDDEPESDRRDNGQSVRPRRFLGAGTFSRGTIATPYRISATSSLRANTVGDLGGNIAEQVQAESELVPLPNEIAQQPGQILQLQHIKNRSRLANIIDASSEFDKEKLQDLIPELHREGTAGENRRGPSLGSRTDRMLSRRKSSSDISPTGPVADSFNDEAYESDDIAVVPPQLADIFDESSVAPSADSTRVSLMKTITGFLQNSLSPSSLREPLASPFAPTEHVFMESSVVVREDEPSSIIAFSLSTQEYAIQLQYRREQRANLTGSFQTDSSHHDTETPKPSELQRIESSSRLVREQSGILRGTEAAFNPPENEAMSISNTPPSSRPSTAQSSGKSGSGNVTARPSMQTHSTPNAPDTANPATQASGSRTGQQATGTFLPPKRTNTKVLETQESLAAVDENQFASSRSWKPKTTSTIKSADDAAAVQGTPQGRGMPAKGVSSAALLTTNGTNPSLKSSASVPAPARTVERSQPVAESSGSATTTFVTTSGTNSATGSTTPTPRSTLGPAGTKWTSKAAADFTNLDKSKVEENLSKLPDTHMRLQFVEGNCKLYCRIYFAEQFDVLRRNCFVEPVYIQSLARCVKWDASGGKSGSMFLKTKDDRFVVKQLSRLELDGFVKFAPSYFAYMTQAVFHDLPTALAKLFGVYRIVIKNLATGKSQRMDLLVMENLFYGHSISRIFDLKGSLRNRHVQKTGRQDQVLLDQNLMEIISKDPLYVREHCKRLLWASVWNDTLFLSKLNVMDYSLLVGFDEKQGRLIVGIVDYVRMFTWDKKLENWVKENGLLGGGGKEPTIVSPKQYKNRFREAMERYFLVVPDKFFKFYLN